MYGSQEKPPENAGKVMEEIGKLNMGVGDKIISRTGTVRKVTDFNIMEYYFDVSTERPGNPPKQERISFEHLLSGLREGIVRIEHAEETEEK